MKVFISTFESIAMLLFIGLLGAWMVIRKMVKEDFFSLLSPLVLEISLPSFVFINIINNFNPFIKKDWWRLPLWWFFFTGIAFIVTLFGMIFVKRDKRREFGIALFYHNGIFFPIAIIGGIFGDNSNYLVDLFLFTIFYVSFFFNTSFLFFKNRGKIEWKKIFHPVFLATLFGIFLKLISFTYIPSFVISALKMVGTMSIPLLMIVLGGNIIIDFKEVNAWYIGEIMKFLFFKNILMPLVMLGFVILIKPPYNVSLLMVLEGAVPPITAVPLIVERNGGNRLIVNQLVFSSFIFSLISIPFVMYLFRVLT
ncbi:MAG: AEC family transporter [candidate division WOR-3 bacterium]